MFRKLFIVVLLLVVFTPSLFAQEPQLPSPRTIFEDSVEVVEVHPVVDNVNRQLSIYHEDAWVTLPYPADLSEIALENSHPNRTEPQRPKIARRPDDTFIFLVPFEDTYGFDTWLADVERETMYRIESPCHLTDYSIDESWVYASLSENTYLCNWITGETSPAFEIRLVRGILGFGAPNLSPDGRFLIVYGAIPRENARGWQVQSYEIATQEFRFIGEFNSGFAGGYDVVEFSGWLSPTIFLIYATYMQEWSSRNLYVGHADEVNSLEFGLSELRFAPRHVYDPPGLETMYAALHDGPSLGPCIVKFYDATTQDYTQYDTGALCELGIPIPDGSGDQLYRAISPDAAVVRYNYFTGERQTLFTGEVEMLGAVAPDGKHGLIALDNSGFVDIEQDRYLDDPFEFEPSEYVVMDLSNGNISGRVPGDAQWWSASILYNQTQLFRINNGHVDVTDLPGEVILTHPDNFLLKTASNELSTYDPLTGDSENVATVPPGYEVNAALLDNGLIQLVFHNPDDDQSALIFDVQLP